MIIFTIIFLGVVYVLWKWLIMIKEAKQMKAPGPMPLPIVGNGHLLLVEAKEFINVLKTFFETYGNVYRIHLLSDKYVVLNHPREVEAIITDVNFNTKGKSYNFLRPWLGQGLLTSTGSRWKNHRKFLTPAFHFNILQNFVPIFQKNNKVLIEKLRKLADGTPIDLFPAITLVALDNVTESIMGISVDAQKCSESKYVKYIEELSNIVSERMRNAFLAEEPIFNLTPQKKRQDKALQYMHEYTRKVIDARRKELIAANITKMEDQKDLGTKNKYAFLDLLLLAEVDGKKINDEWIREEVDTFMFEGHDTTSSGIVYCLHSISQNMDVQSKIYDELMMIFNNDAKKEIQFSDLSNMKYLELVIKESLRLYPSVPLMERLVLKDTDVGDVHLLEGTSVIINIFQMQRNPELFKDPLEFRPERFLTDEMKSAFSWIAFSAGPRNCIGQKFAMLEMKVIISEIVRDFILLPVDKKNDFTANLILKSPGGVNVALKPRVK